MSRRYTNLTVSYLFTSLAATRTAHATHALEEQFRSPQASSPHGSARLFSVGSTGRCARLREQRLVSHGDAIQPFVVSHQQISQPSVVWEC